MANVSSDIGCPQNATFHGIGANEYLGFGVLSFFEDCTEEVNTEYLGKEAELVRIRKAKHEAAEALRDMASRTEGSLGNDEAEIFEIHAMLLMDEDYTEAILTEINKGATAEAGVRIASEKYSLMLESLGDEYLSARSADIKDISGQLLDALSGDVDEIEDFSTQPYILVSPDLTPSQTVRLDQSKILAFVTFGGTPSSHTAILARSMGIPALVGTGAIDASFEGKMALLNAEAGTLVVCPTREEIRAFEKEKESYNKIALEHQMYLRSVMNKPAVTRSGHHIMIYANVGGENEISSATSNGAEGIGLLRSEFLYLTRKNYPSEEELFASYRDIAIKMQGKRVIVRTLDVGADKQIPYFNIPREENPALGYRAIRVCLDRREMFKTQLRAILRASAFGRVAIMLPMIVSVDEVRQSKGIIEECKGELLTQGASFDSKIELGIMIETPASAIMAEELAREVDFFSVGTNDLTQYTLAADRQNQNVTRICEENSEPVLRLIKMATDAIHGAGGWIGVCGEMAADLNLIQRFADIGVDELSVSVPYLLGVRGKVSECR